MKDVMYNSICVNKTFFKRYMVDFSKVKIQYDMYKDKTLCDPWVC